VHLRLEKTGKRVKTRNCGLKSSKGQTQGGGKIGIRGLLRFDATHHSEGGWVRDYTEKRKPAGLQPKSEAPAREQD